MYKFLTTSEIDYNKWSDLVDNSITATFFQTSECFNFYKRLDFLTPFLFGLEVNSDLKAIVCGYILSENGTIKRYFSRRAIIPGGILLATEINTDILTEFLKYIRVILSKKAIYLEIRNFNSYKNYLYSFKKAGFHYQKHLNFHLDLSEPQKVRNNLSTNIKRQIKQTQKNDVICYLSNEETDIFEFYDILSELYFSKIKTPLFPVGFFIELSKLNSAKFFVVKNNEKTVGGIFCVVLNKKTVYEWYICGKDLSNIYPSSFATWSGIEYGLNNDFVRFDFMGAGRPGEKYGVREFKAKFGGKLVEYGRFMVINNLFLYHLGASFINIKKLLKN